jgi:hypothetical protein
MSIRTDIEKDMADLQAQIDAKRNQLQMVSSAIGGLVEEEEDKLKVYFDQVKAHFGW